MALPFAFPPTEPNWWRSLGYEARMLWLCAARDRAFAQSDPFVASKIPGRRVVLDGTLVDDLLAFYCTIGEAVNGPGGYFGLTMEAFNDCLYGGFGLEFPYTIVWRNAARSASVLDSAALLSYLDTECSYELDPKYFAEGLAWRETARAAARSGNRTMFDEIAETIRDVSVKNGYNATLVLE